MGEVGECTRILALWGDTTVMNLAGLGEGFFAEPLLAVVFLFAIIIFIAGTFTSRQHRGRYEIKLTLEFEKREHERESASLKEKRQWHRNWYRRWVAPGVICEVTPCLCQAQSGACRSLQEQNACLSNPVESGSVKCSLSLFSGQFLAQVLLGAHWLARGRGSSGAFLLVIGSGRVGGGACPSLWYLVHTSQLTEGYLGFRGTPT